MKTGTRPTAAVVNHLEELANLANVDALAVTTRHNRYRGKNQLAYAVDDNIRADYKAFTVNLCRVAVDSIAERIRLKSVDADQGNADQSDRARRLVKRANFDETLTALVTEMLALGKSYALVWPDSRGRVTVTAESPLHLTADLDPINGDVTRAVKRWSVDTGHGTDEYAALYLPDVTTIVKGSNGGYSVVSEVPNPLGFVPLVPLVNRSRPGGAGGSVIDDMGHLVDALSKVLVDMLVTSEDVARPRRWATGVTLKDGPEELTEWTADGDQTADYGSFDDDEAVSPFDEGNRMWTAESEAARFGQLDGANLAGYQTAVDLLVQQISAVSGLPAHVMGVTTANPTSADATRASEAGLTARAESRINVVAVAVESIVSIMLAMDTGRLPEDFTVNAAFASPATRSTAQEADAVSKLHALGIINTDEAREMMGIKTL